MVRGGPRTRGFFLVGLQIVFVAAAYYLAAQIGLRLAVVNEQVTPLWPPTGIALACLLLLGVRCWPGITLGAFLANVALGPTLPVVVAISVSNTLAPVCACLLLRRAGFRMELDRLRDTLALVFLGVGGMLISATVGAGMLWLAGALPIGFWATWSVWWAGDAMGVLVVAPVLLVASQVRWRWRAPRSRVLEAAALMIGTVAVTVVVTRTSVHLLFLVFPFLIWAALRFQQRGAAPCALIVSMGTVLAAVDGSGLFAGLALLPKMIILLSFNAIAVLTSLLLAAITTQRNDALRAMERATVQLAEAVRALEPYRLLRDGLLDGVLPARTSNDRR